MEALLDALKTGYGLTIRRLTPMRGGSDSQAQAYEAVTDGGERWFVKHRRRLDPGVTLASALAESGITEVLAPIRTRSGAAGYPAPSGVLLVYPFIEGCDGIRKPLTLPQWEHLGSAVRRIHDAVLPDDVLEAVAVESFSIANVDEFLERLEHLSELPGLASPEGALAESVRKHYEAIKTTVSRTQALGSQCQARDWTTVPCHADLHVGNVMIGGSVHIVDWDHPRLAPRECDLIFFCDGGILREHGAAEEAAFFFGYGLMSPDPTAMAYYWYARVLEDLVAFASEVVDESRPIEERWEAVRYFDIQFAPNSVLEVAMRSDRGL